MYVVLTSENQDPHVPLRAPAALDHVIRDKYNLCNPKKIGRPEHLHAGSVKDIKVLRDHNCPHGSPKFYKIFKRRNFWNQTTNFGGNANVEMFWSSILHKKERSYVYQVCVLKEHHLINISFKRVNQINHHEDVGIVIGID